MKSKSLDEDASSQVVSRAFSLPVPRNVHSILVDEAQDFFLPFIFAQRDGVNDMTEISQD